MNIKIDHINLSLLRIMQTNPDYSQRELADQVGLSQNACWRRLKQLEQSGIIEGRRLVLDRAMLGLDLVVFMMIQTQNHSSEWLKAFRSHVISIPEVADFYRIGGDYDYMLKVITEDMVSYDKIYQRLIQKTKLEKVTSYFSMEAIAENRSVHI
ncbi:transcriptional regulator [Kiloniella spongiae]|uniref:Transcriptional regulator n=1 Tax=Kiloniella spongiae TaxID=1489064 RepID=A0A0H2MBK4_9PROT|nr:Lrp/AsnC family transcriptional regulator [Kiloniella spongiae]KLN59571.1 transcriptional regulator [Kiloniella spongiae]